MRLRVTNVARGNDVAEVQVRPGPQELLPGRFRARRVGDRDYRDAALLERRDEGGSLWVDLRGVVRESDDRVALAELARRLHRSRPEGGSVRHREALGVDLDRILALGTEAGVDRFDGPFYLKKFR